MSSSRQALLCVFLLGCLLGVVSGSRYQRMAFQRFWQNGPNTERALARLNRKLDLDAGQRQAVKPILERRREKMKALHVETSRRVRELRQSMRAELAPLLRPEQNRKLEELAARWDRKHLKMDADAK